MTAKNPSMSMVIKLVRITGLLFMAAGFTLAWFPEKLDDYLDDYLANLSLENTQYIGGILIVIGMVDILILPRILNIKNNETK